MRKIRDKDGSRLRASCFNREWGEGALNFDRRQWVWRVRRMVGGPEFRRVRFGRSGSAAKFGSHGLEETVRTFSVLHSASTAPVGGDAYWLILITRMPGLTRNHLEAWRGLFVILLVSGAYRISGRN
jgi:hypothetical protein